MREYSKPIVDVFSNYLTENDWNYSFDEDKGLFRFGLSLQGKIKSIEYLIRVRADSFVVDAVSPIGGDEEDPQQMASLGEFLHRANFGLTFGNFEFDYRDGEIRYKYSVDCEGIIPSEGMVENSIFIPARMFDRYSAGIIDILYGGVSAQEANKRCDERYHHKMLSLMSGVADEDPEEETSQEEHPSVEESDSDISDMIARLARRFGGAEDSGSEDDGDSSVTSADASSGAMPDLPDTQKKAQ